MMGGVAYAIWGDTNIEEVKVNRDVRLEMKDPKVPLQDIQ